MCPRCGNRRVHASRRRTLPDRLFDRFLIWRPYRCHACGRRFHASIPRNGSTSFARSVQEREAAARTIIDLGKYRDDVDRKKTEP
jgi:DNA-directed RNA polymerase subunit RPC12/RpoP